MAKERKIHIIDKSHKRSVELRKKIDEKRWVIKVTIWKTTNWEPISKRDTKKLKWTLWRP